MHKLIISPNTRCVSDEIFFARDVVKKLLKNFLHVFGHIPITYLANDRGETRLYENKRKYTSFFFAVFDISHN